MPSSHSPFHELIDCIPEISELPPNEKNNAINFISKKFRKLHLKLTASHFEPLSENDPLNLNTHFDQAILKWIAQFDKEHRLGLLICIMSIIYISRKELEALLQIVINKYKSEQARSRKELLDPKIQNRKVSLYSLSQTSLYEDIKNKISIPFTKDTRPYDGIFINLLEATFQNLQTIADPNLNNIDEYKQDEFFPKITRVIEKMLDCDYVLIEDCSYSGTTIKSDLKKLIKLIEIVFIPYEKYIQNSPYGLPRFYLLLPLCTKKALTEIESVLSGKPELSKYFSISNIITGYVFDEDYRFRKGWLPVNVRQFHDLFKRLMINQKVNEAIKYFHDSYSHNYWTDEMLLRTPMSAEEQYYGYRGGGWSIVSFHNCPNNSLPLFWYPNIGSTQESPTALFKRNESRSKHDSFLSDEIKRHIEMAEKDPDKILKKYLTRYYEKYK